MHPSYQEIATSFHLWQVYADPSGHDTEEDFNAASEEAKVAFLVQCFGKEENAS